MNHVPSQDFLLAKYSVIIVDEAHERGLNTDVLLGLLSRIVTLRQSMCEERDRLLAANPNAKRTSFPPLRSPSLSRSFIGPSHSTLPSPGFIPFLSSIAAVEPSLARLPPASGVSQGRLRLIIMSATMEARVFMQNTRLFPATPHAVKVESRQYPVVKHFARVTAHDYVKKALQKVCILYSSSVS